MMIGVRNAGKTAIFEEIAVEKERNERGYTSYLKSRAAANQKAKELKGKKKVKRKMAKASKKKNR